MQRLIISAIVWMLAATYSFGAFASVMRLRFGDAGPVGMGYQQVLLPMILLLCCAFLVETRKIHIDKFAVVLLTLVVYGAIWGAVRNGFNSFFISHMFEGLFSLGLYLAGLNLRDDKGRQFIRQLRVLAYLVTIFHVGIMALYLYWLATAGIYFGMSASILILAVTIFIFDCRWYWAGLAGFMVMITGKRGEIAGLILAILITFAIQGRIAGARRTIKQFIVGATAAAIVLLVVSDIFGSNIVSALGTKFTRVFQGDYSDLSSPEAKAAIGGRAVELLVFYQTFFESEHSPLWSGLGYGWSVPVDVPGYEENEALHFVHVSPLNTIAQCGLLLAFVYWASLLGTVVRAIRSSGDNRQHGPLVPYVVAMIAISFTAYVIAVDPMVWLCVGILAQGQQRLLAQIHSTRFAKG